MTPPSVPGPAMAAPLNQRGLAQWIALLGLMRKARTLTDPTAFAFSVVNETRLLTDFRQAALWRGTAEGGGYVETVSGLAVADRDAPYILWLSAVLAQLARRTASGPGESIALVWQPVSPEAGVAAVPPGGRGHLAVAEVLPEVVAAEWSEWLPHYGLWLPLTLFRGDQSAAVVLGGLFLARETPWPETERQLLEELAGTYALVWQNLLVRRTLLARWNDALFGQPWRLGRVAKVLLCLLALAALALPVRQSVLAPAVVTAANPVFVRAPLAGIIDRFHVVPNAVVEEGQLLFSLEETPLRNQLDTARNEEEVAAAEYRQAVQKATRDPQRVVQSTLQEKRWEQKKADVAFLAERLSRVDVRATRRGIAVFSDVNDWIGRPVKLGERILTLADPQQVELEVHLPVADAINLEVGAEVAMFLNINPEAPLPGVLEYASYQAEMTAEGILSYRIKARFTDPQRVPRIGLAGFARIYHQSVSLFTLLTRRPLAVVRRWVGF
ncbi:MAG: HlyD family efflux transporter periplasmic adaptor subunit [Magnetococcales bacterium]|nr:HlyD family efflux transporter periplasmic adaptor subunit [Magnetococcales bacterium]